MAFIKKTWKDRLVEFAGRRQIVRASGDPNGTMVVDVTRAEGNVSQAGDAFSAANMNDMEQRIADGFKEVINDLGGFKPIIDSATGKITGYKTQVGADTVFPFNSNYKITFTLSVQSRQYAGRVSNIGSTTVSFSIIDGNVSPPSISGTINSSKATSNLDGYSYFYTDYTITNITVKKL